MQIIIDNWDKILTAIIALYAAILSTYIHVENKRKEKESKTNTDGVAVSKLFHETNAKRKSLLLLDEWMFEKKVFTRKKRILDALSEILIYWRTYEYELRKRLGADSKLYVAMEELYKVALSNRDNQPPPDGNGEWIGITDKSFSGLTVEELFNETSYEIERLKG